MNAAASPAGTPARFAAAFVHGPAALLYHKIDYLKTGVLRRGLYVSPRIFATQLAELRQAGFTAVKAAAATRAKSPRSILLTFDDGFLDNLEHALPALQATSFTAINFLVAHRLGEVNSWDLPDGERPAPLMGEGHIREWLAAGQEIGAHTLTHAHLTRLSPDAAREEIAASKKSLEDRFGLAVTDFAYPYGELNSAIKDLVAEAGFLRAWTTQPGVLTPQTEPLALPRHAVMVSLRHPLNLWRSLPPFGKATPSHPSAAA